MLTAIGNVMRELHSRGWITTRAGNISLCRHSKRTIYITPSGWRKSIIHPEHIVKVMLTETGMEVPEGQKPSGELHMHWLLQKNSVETRAVVHAHPTNTIAAMYRGYDLMKLCDQFPEIFRYTRVGPTVKAYPAVSEALGRVTARAFDLKGDGGIEYDIVGQANHGVTAVASDPWSAFEHIERLEHICQIVLLSGVSPEEVELRPPVPRN